MAATNRGLRYFLGCHFESVPIALPGYWKSESEYSLYMNCGTNFRIVFDFDRTGKINGCD
ncbi:MAG: hypothetical protein JXQ65_02115 [Candidatus Marinimicrobia bacterium]|nr:hypothetical protein [Candidatus Neomarinimicrobiota bacterium]